MNRRMFAQMTVGTLLGFLQNKEVGARGHKRQEPDHYYIDEGVEPVLWNDNSIYGIMIEDDRFSVELNRAQLIVVAARPSMGKSVLIRNIAQHMSMSGEVSIGYFSEQKIPSLVNMMLLTQKELSQSDMELAQRMVSRYSIVIDDASQITMQELDMSIKAKVSDKDIQLLLIDSIDNIYIPNAKPEEKMAEVVLYLKRISRTLQIPVIISIGLNEDVYEREDKRPILTDIVNYRMIDSYADSVTYLYRDEVYHESSEHEGLVLISSVDRCGRSSTLMRLDRSTLCLKSPHKG